MLLNLWINTYWVFSTNQMSSKDLFSLKPGLIMLKGGSLYHPGSI